jgi:RNA polymerase sigma factor (sigma-70 family)
LDTAFPSHRIAGGSTIRRDAAPPRPQESGPLISDADLVRRCLDDDASAWSAILARYADLAHSLLRRAGLSDAAAQDAFQEVAVLLWKSLPKLREVDRLASWVGTTTRRVAWRLRKQERTRVGHESAARRTEQVRDVDPRAFDEEQALRESLAELGTRCRELLSLLYFQSSDLSYDEIAARLGMPRGSLGPTRQRCIDTLREGLLARGVGSDVSDDRLRVSAPVKGRSGPRKPRA